MRDHSSATFGQEEAGDDGLPRGLERLVRELKELDMNEVRHKLDEQRAQQPAH